MRLKEQIAVIPEDKLLLLDTSAVLADEDVLSYPNEKFITSGVFKELYSLQFDGEELRGQLARERYKAVDSRIRRDLWYYKSECTPPTIPGLSAVDENLLHVASRLHNVVLLSCDSTLCHVARMRGIDVRSIRTNAS
ncbi:MAG: hypothetical protein IJ217_04395 [Clostridia bacterium]|nr:hypothetical protein [Clostridia bacterium]